MADQNHPACQTCKPRRAVNSPFLGPMMGRRSFFQIAGAGVAGYFLTPLLKSSAVMAQDYAPHLLGTAKNCIFLMLPGAPSNVDTFDLKVGSWTPADFNPTTYSGINFPQGLMPNIAGQFDKIAIVRTVRSTALVHQLMQTWTQIARNPSAALGKIAPNIGAVVAAELEAQRTTTQKLPGFVSLNTGGNLATQGYFSARYAPFDITAAPNGLPNLINPDGQNLFTSRYSILQSVDGSLRGNSPLGDDVTAMDGFYKQSRDMMYNPNVTSVFQFSSEDQQRYGNNGFGNSCIVARNLVKANLGTRYVQINLGGWDNHQQIYSKQQGIYPPATALDKGMANLIIDLANTPGSISGKSKLDETLIVAMGEFGRTVGPLTQGQGRDHYFQHFAVFAGGGVKGGRVIGTTTPDGGNVADPGWSQNRYVAAEDLACTVYAALGIDYTKTRHDDPFGRGFEYVPFAAEGLWYPVLELF